MKNKIIQSSFSQGKECGEVNVRTMVQGLTSNGKKLFEIYQVKEPELISSEFQSYWIEHRNFGYKEDMQKILNLLVD